MEHNLLLAGMLIELKVAITAAGVELEVPFELTAQVGLWPRKQSKFFKFTKKQLRKQVATMQHQVSLFQWSEVFDSDHDIMKIKREC